LPDRLEEPLLGMLADEPLAKIAQNAQVNAFIVRREAERILAVPSLLVLLSGQNFSTET
jgi:hypothetical protein